MKSRQKILNRNQEEESGENMQPLSRRRMDGGKMMSVYLIAD
jgi:hypothetical protein